MTNARTLLAATTLASVFALNSAPAHAAGVAAGTLIENTASASFTVGTTTQSVNSNTVTVQVDELLDVTLTSQDSSAVPIGGSSAVLTFEITNIGNGPEAFVLTADPSVTGNDFNVTVTGIAYDADGNGLYDPSIDITLGAGAPTPVIAADGTLTVFVLANPPAGITEGQTSRVSLNADALTGTGAPGTTFAGQGVNGSDAVVGTTNADADAPGPLVARLIAVTLAKSATVADPFSGSEAVPGAIVTYTLVATVTGTGSVQGLRITDGIPTGTTYAANSLTLGGAPLTDAADSDAGQGGASGIDVLVGQGDAGNSYTVTFNVTIN